MRNNWFVNFLPEIVLNIKNSNWNYQFDHFSTTDQSRAKNFRQRENEKFYPQHGYFLASCLDDSRTIACPAAFYASAKLTPRSSILETRLYPPPRNVPLARLQFHARHFRPPTLTLSPIPFPISFFHFCFPAPPVAAAQFGNHCQDPIELPTRNANFRRQEAQGLSFPLITLFPANWKQLRHLRARARFN